MILSGLIVWPAVGWADDASNTASNPQSASSATASEQSSDAAIRAIAERITAEQTRQVAAASAATASPASVASAPATTAPPAPLSEEKGLPLPLHTIEGVGGVGLTEMAYLVNPSTGDNWLGLPAASATHVQARYNNAEIVSVSETLFKRLELSASFDDVGLGDFDKTVKDKLGANLSSDWVQMYVASARLALLNEGEFGQSWLPAVTAGVHYKYNATINQFNDDLSGALNKVVGVKDNQGEDFTLTATKMFKTALPRPVFVSGTVRETDAADMGWLGFTHRYETVFEGNVGVFATDNLVLAAEYRQMPNDLKQVSGVLGPESDWWTIAATYILSKHTNISVAYANLGNMLNHREPAALWVQFKYEF
jgi:hypothetical protein